jgi:hypothetical protein
MEDDMGIWKECVIDASMGCSDGMFCFCPIEGDIAGEFAIVTGMNYISKAPHGTMKLVGIVHPDGNEAVERFCHERKPELEALKSFLDLNGGPCGERSSTS